MRANKKMELAGALRSRLISKSWAYPMGRPYGSTGIDRIAVVTASDVGWSMSSTDPDPATRRRPIHLVPWVLAGVVGLIGCQQSGDLRETLMLGGEYDTSGAVIIERRTVPQNLPVWLIEDTAAVRIGRVSGEGVDVFGRIAAVAATSKGEIVVAETRPLGILQFDREGQLRFRAGRSGEGPGEFRIMTNLIVTPGDSLMVLAVAPPRAVLFDPHGEYVRTTTLRSDDAERRGAMEYRGVLDNGTIVATRSVRAGSIIHRNYRRFLKELTFLDPSGALIHRGSGFFDPILFSERVSIEQPGGPISAMAMRTPPIAGRAVYAVRGTHVAVGVQGRGEILVHDEMGRVVVILRPPGWGIPTDRSRYLRNAAARDTSSPSAAADEPAEVTASHLPDTLPGFERIMLDAVGRLWVEEFVPDYEVREASWWIFDMDGRFVARARFPAGFRPYDIEANEVIGITRNDMDVEFVERRRIVRPATP